MASRRHFIGTNGTEAGEMEAPIIPAADVADGSIPVFDSGTDEWTEATIAELVNDLGAAPITTTGAITGGDLAATDDLTVGDDAAVGGDLAVTGDATVSGSLIGEADIQGQSLGIANNVSVGGALILEHGDGDVQLVNDGGDTIYVQRVVDSEPANLNVALLSADSLGVGQNADVGGDLAVTGAATIGGLLEAADLSVSVNATITGDLGATNITASASIDAATFIDAGTEFRRNGTKILGAQGDAVADAAGGATIDAEARTAINLILARLRAHGLIAT